MVKARSPAASQLAARPSVATEKPEQMRPSASASLRETRPAGIGRLAVRLITASISASYHILRAPEPPAPTAMQRMTMAPRMGSMPPGASSRPTTAVKTTSDITRGFRSAK
jgi:hypothetical protein